MMSVIECVRARIETREFTPDPVPESVLQKILEAGRWSPSQRNRQPWHFIIVQERETLGQLAALAPSGSYLADAPLAIVVVTEGARRRHACHLQHAAGRLGGGAGQLLDRGG